MVNEQIVNEFMETKKKYIKPRIEIIFLDSAIALELESAPPSGPGELGYNAPQHFNAQPFRVDLA